jgi:hypothetical protein
LRSGRWLARRDKDLFEKLKEPVKKESERYAFFGVLERASAAWRVKMLQLVMREYRPRARFVITGGDVRLHPDHHDLRGCVGLLLVELLHGGWKIRRCEKCGQYLGQWTKRERRFCDDGCRTAYHNNSRRSAATPRRATLGHRTPR